MNPVIWHWFLWIVNRYYSVSSTRAFMDHLHWCDLMELSGNGSAIVALLWVWILKCGNSIEMHPLPNKGFLVFEWWIGMIWTTSLFGLSHRMISRSTNPKVEPRLFGNFRPTHIGNGTKTKHAVIKSQLVKASAFSFDPCEGLFG
jgi:hypothetical protein